MRILHIITGLTTGGAEMMLYKLLKQTKDNAEHTVISLSPKFGYLKNSIETLGVNVHVLGINMRSPINPISSILKLRKLISTIKPDLIQGWMYHGNVFASVAGMLYKAPVVWNIRCTLYDIKKSKRLTQFFIQANKWLSKKPQAIIYNSTISKIQHEKFGFSNDKSLVIANGFDINLFSFSAKKRQAFRTQYGFNENDFVVGHIARFHPMKGHQTFIDAAKQVIASNKNVYFILAGTHVELANPIFQQLLNGSRVAKWFKLLGEQKNIAEILQLFDTFVLSSSHGEGFPNVVGEAMACNIPCIATDVGDAGYVIGKTGFIVPPSNPERLAEAMKRMIAMDRDERQALGHAARTRIEEHFTMPVIAKQYLALYNSL